MRADDVGHWAAIVRPAPAYDRSVVVYRPATHQLIEFGGLARGVPSNVVRTFSLDAPAAGWTRLEVVGTQPAARYGHVGLYDPVRDRLVIFGGRNTPGTLTDAWALDLADTVQWHALPAGGGPPTASYLGAAIYDSARDRLLYFGGSLDGNTGITNQLWAMPLGDETGWQALAPAGSILVHTDHSMIYDAARDVAIVFAGKTTGVTNITYQLTLEPSLGWSTITTTNPKPAARFSHAAIYDAANQRMVMWGGHTGSDPKNDVWTLALDATGKWTQLAPGGVAPSARQWPRAVWDETGARMLSAGGGVRGDVHALSLGGAPAWSTIYAQPVSPRGGPNQTLLLDTARRRLYLFDPYTSVYRMSLDTLWQWTNLAPTGHLPEPGYTLREYAVVFDSVRNRILIEHGQSQTSGGMWQLPLASAGAAWTVMPVSPWSGDENSIVLDPARDRLVRFGGHRMTFPFGNITGVQTLNLAPLGPWVGTNPGGDAFPPPYDHRAVLDRARDRMLVHGGSFYDFYSTTEVYALQFGSTPVWQLLPKTPTYPPLCEKCGLALDSGRDRLLRVGDYPANSVWTTAIGATLDWVELHPPGPGPGPRYELSTVFDAAGDRLFAFGGGTAGYDDTLFVLEFGATTVVGVPPAAPAPARLALARLWPNPSSGSTLRLELATPRAETIQLDVFDLAGRRVATQAFNAPSPGVHQATLALGERLGAGVFWLRASNAQETRSLRFVRMN